MLELEKRKEERGRRERTRVERVWREGRRLSIKRV